MLEMIMLPFANNLILLKTIPNITQGREIIFIILVRKQICPLTERDALSLSPKTFPFNTSILERLL